MNLRSLPLLFLFVFALFANTAYAQKASVENRMRRFLGDGVAHCGSFHFKSFEPRHLTSEKLSTVSSCLVAARKEGKAWFFSLEGGGIDSYVASGVLGFGNGDIYRFTYDSDPCGGSGCGEAFSVALCVSPNTSEIPDLEKTCGIRLRAPELPPDRNAV